jgi:HEAT repeat protein
MTPALLLACVVAASSTTTHRAQSKRADAQDLVEQIESGNGVLNSVARLHVLGEEAYATAELSRTLASSVDERQREDVVQAISQLGHPSAENVLLSVLGDKDGAIRMNAVAGLGRIHSKSTAKIRPLLADKTMGVRREAARALGASHDPKMGPLLVAAAKAEGEPEARAAMLVAVGQVGDKSQSKALEAFLSNSSESTRFAAAQALCLLASPAGFEVAKKKLASKDRYERLQGLALFEGSKAKDAQGMLKPLEKDPDKEVGAMAARILYQGGDATALEWLVVSSFKATGEDKLYYEKELETLRLADDQRKAILARAGIK